MDAIGVDQMNERDAAMRQARRDRMEAEGRGFDSVYGQ